MNLRSHLTKIFSVFLSILIFATHCALADSIQSNFWKERKATTQPNEPIQLASLPLTSITNPQIPKPNVIPFTNGSIRKINFPSIPQNARSVFHIQDVHMNIEAQINIGKTIQSLIDNNQVDLIALEGAFTGNANDGLIDFKNIRAFPHPEITKEVADDLLRSNQISGPIHAALTSAHDIPAVVGIDDENHYEKNVEAYKAAALLVDKNRKQLNRMKKSLQEKKNAVFNSDLRTFDQRVEAYRDGTISLAEYIKGLNNARGSFSIETFLSAYQLESTLNFPQVEKERTFLINDLTKKLSTIETEALTQSALAYRTGVLRHTAFYEYLKNLCDQKKIDLSRYKLMNAYIQYVLLSESIDGEKLSAEAKSLENETFASLIKSPAELKIVAESRRLFLVGKLLDFALTKEEWTEYEATRYRVIPAETGTMGPRFRGDDESLVPFEQFYVEAETRDRLMAENLSRAMEKFHARRAVLVTGGFHSGGIESLLVKRDLSYVSFTPRITKVDGSGSAYLGLFAQEKTPLDKLFAGEKLFLAARINPLAIFRRMAVLDCALALRPRFVSVPVLSRFLEKAGSLEDVRIDASDSPSISINAIDPVAESGPRPFAVTVDVKNQMSVPIGLQVREQGTAVLTQCKEILAKLWNLIPRFPWEIHVRVVEWSGFGISLPWPIFSIEPLAMQNGTHDSPLRQDVSAFTNGVMQDYHRFGYKTYQRKSLKLLSSVETRFLALLNDTLDFLAPMRQGFRAELSGISKILHHELGLILFFKAQRMRVDHQPRIEIEQTFYDSLRHLKLYGTRTHSINLFIALIHDALAEICLSKLQEQPAESEDTTYTALLKLQVYEHSLVAGDIVFELMKHNYTSPYFPGFDKATYSAWRQRADERRAPFNEFAVSHSNLALYGAVYYYWVIRGNTYRVAKLAMQLINVRGLGQILEKLHDNNFAFDDDLAPILFAERFMKSARPGKSRIAAFEVPLPESKTVFDVLVVNEEENKEWGLQAGPIPVEIKSPRASNVNGEFNFARTDRQLDDISHARKSLFPDFPTLQPAVLVMTNRRVKEDLARINEHHGVRLIHLHTDPRTETTESQTPVPFPTLKELAQIQMHTPNLKELLEADATKNQPESKARPIRKMFSAMTQTSPDSIGYLASGNKWIGYFSPVAEGFIYSLFAYYDTDVMVAAFAIIFAIFHVALERTLARPLFINGPPNKYISFMTHLAFGLLYAPSAKLHDSLPWFLIYVAIVLTGQIYKDVAFINATYNEQFNIDVFIKNSSANLKLYRLIINRVKPEGDQESERAEAINQLQFQTMIGTLFTAYKECLEKHPANLRDRYARIFKKNILNLNFLVSLYQRFDYKNTEVANIIDRQLGNPQVWDIAPSSLGYLMLTHRWVYVRIHPLFKKIFGDADAAIRLLGFGLVFCEGLFLLWWLNDASPLKMALTGIVYLTFHFVLGHHNINPNAIRGAPASLGFQSLIYWFYCVAPVSLPPWLITLPLLVNLVIDAPLIFRSSATEWEHVRRVPAANNNIPDFTVMSTKTKEINGMKEIKFYLTFRDDIGALQRVCFSANFRRGQEIYRPILMIPEWRGSRNDPLLQDLTQRLTLEGNICFRVDLPYNHRANNSNESSGEATHFEFSKPILPLEIMLGILSTHSFLREELPRVDFKQLILMGQSYGGCVLREIAVKKLYGSKKLGGVQIAALFEISTPLDYPSTWGMLVRVHSGGRIFKKITIEQAYAAWKRKGVFPYPNAQFKGYRFPMADTEDSENPLKDLLARIRSDLPFYFYVGSKDRIILTDAGINTLRTMENAGVHVNEYRTLNHLYDAGSWSPVVAQIVQDVAEVRNNGQHQEPQIQISENIEPAPTHRRVARAVGPGSFLYYATRNKALGYLSPVLEGVIFHFLIEWNWRVGAVVAVLAAAWLVALEQSVGRRYFKNPPAEDGYSFVVHLELFALYFSDVCMPLVLSENVLQSPYFWIARLAVFLFALIPNVLYDVLYIEKNHIDDKFFQQQFEIPGTFDFTLPTTSEPHALSPSRIEIDDLFRTTASTVEEFKIYFEQSPPSLDFLVQKPVAVIRGKDRFIFTEFESHVRTMFADLGEIYLRINSKLPNPKVFQQWFEESILNFASLDFLIREIYKSSLTPEQYVKKKYLEKFGPLVEKDIVHAQFMWIFLPFIAVISFCQSVLADIKPRIMTPLYERVPPAEILPPIAREGITARARLVEVLMAVARAEKKERDLEFVAALAKWTHISDSLDTLPMFRENTIPTNVFARASKLVDLGRHPQSTRVSAAEKKILNSVEGKLPINEWVTLQCIKIRAESFMALKHAELDRIALARKLQKNAIQRAETVLGLVGCHAEFAFGESDFLSVHVAKLIGEKARKNLKEKFIPGVDFRDTATSTNLLTPYAMLVEAYHALQSNHVGLAMKKWDEAAAFSSRFLREPSARLTPEEIQGSILILLRTHSAESYYYKLLGNSREELNHRARAIEAARHLRRINPNMHPENFFSDYFFGFPDHDLHPTIYLMIEIWESTAPEKKRSQAGLFFGKSGQESPDFNHDVLEALKKLERSANCTDFSGFTRLTKRISPDAQTKWKAVLSAVRKKARENRKKNTSHSHIFMDAVDQLNTRWFGPNDELIYNPTFDNEKSSTEFAANLVVTRILERGPTFRFSNRTFRTCLVGPVPATEGVQDAAQFVPTGMIVVNKDILIRHLDQSQNDLKTVNKVKITIRDQFLQLFQINKTKYQSRYLQSMIETAAIQSLREAIDQSALESIVGAPLHGLEDQQEIPSLFYRHLVNKRPNSSTPLLYCERLMTDSHSPLSEKERHKIIYKLSQLIAHAARSENPQLVIQMWLDNFIYPDLVKPSDLLAHKLALYIWGHELGLFMGGATAGFVTQLDSRAWINLIEQMDEISPSHLRAAMEKVLQQEFVNGADVIPAFSFSLQDPVSLSSKKAEDLSFGSVIKKYRQNRQKVMPPIGSKESSNETKKTPAQVAQRDSFDEPYFSKIREQVADGIKCLYTEIVSDDRTSVLVVADVGYAVPLFELLVAFKEVHIVSFGTNTAKKLLKQNLETLTPDQIPLFNRLAREKIKEIKTFGLESRDLVEKIIPIIANSKSEDEAVKNLIEWFNFIEIVDTNFFSGVPKAHYVVSVCHVATFDRLMSEVVSDTFKAKFKKDLAEVVKDNHEFQKAHRSMLSAYAANFGADLVEYAPHTLFWAEHTAESPFVSGSGHHSNAWRENIANYLRSLKPKDIFKENAETPASQELLLYYGKGVSPTFHAYIDSVLSETDPQFTRKFFAMIEVFLLSALRSEWRLSIVETVVTLANGGKEKAEKIICPHPAVPTVPGDFKELRPPRKLLWIVDPIAALHGLGGALVTESVLLRRDDPGAWSMTHFLQGLSMFMMIPFLKSIFSAASQIFSSSFRCPLPESNRSSAPLGQVNQFLAGAPLNMHMEIEKGLEMINQETMGMDVVVPVLAATCDMSLALQQSRTAKSLTVFVEDDSAQQQMEQSIQNLTQSWTAKPIINVRVQREGLFSQGRFNPLALPANLPEEVNRLPENLRLMLFRRSDVASESNLPALLQKLKCILLEPENGESGVLHLRDLMLRLKNERKTQINA